MWAGIHSLTQTQSHEHSFLDTISKGRSGHWPCLGTCIPAPVMKRKKNVDGRRWTCSLKAQNFHLSKTSNSLNVLKKPYTHPMLSQYLENPKAGLPKHNYCHCYQQITSYYGFHRFLTLQICHHLFRSEMGREELFQAPGNPTIISVLPGSVEHRNVKLQEAGSSLVASKKLRPKHKGIKHLATYSMPHGLLQYCCHCWALTDELFFFCHLRNPRSLDETLQEWLLNAWWRRSSS